MKFLMIVLVTALNALASTSAAAQPVACLEEAEKSNSDEKIIRMCNALCDTEKDEMRSFGMKTEKTLLRPSEFLKSEVLMPLIGQLYETYNTEDKRDKSRQRIWLNLNHTDMNLLQQAAEKFNQKQRQKHLVQLPLNLKTAKAQFPQKKAEFGQLWKQITEAEKELSEQTTTKWGSLKNKITEKLPKHILELRAQKDICEKDMKSAQGVVLKTPVDIFKYQQLMERLSSFQFNLSTVVAQQVSDLEILKVLSLVVNGQRKFNIFLKLNTGVFSFVVDKETYEIERLDFGSETDLDHFIVACDNSNTRSQKELHFKNIPSKMLLPLYDGVAEPWIVDKQSYAKWQEKAEASIQKIFDTYKPQTFAETMDLVLAISESQGLAIKANPKINEALDSSGRDETSWFDYLNYLMDCAYKYAYLQEMHAPFSLTDENQYAIYRPETMDFISRHAQELTNATSELMQNNYEYFNHNPSEHEIFRVTENLTSNNELPEQAQRRKIEDAEIEARRQMQTLPK